MPPYICITYLTSRCWNETRGQARDPRDALTRCPDGFHPKLEDLVDPDQFHQRMASIILLRDQQKITPGGVASETQSQQQQQSQQVQENAQTSEMQASPSQEDQCAVCLESVKESHKNFGLLEHCDHIFCAECILTWHQRGPPIADGPPVAGSRRKQCPMCRTQSTRIAICQRIPDNSQEKSELFEQQYRCLELVKGTNRNDDDDDNSSSSSSSSSEDEGDDNPLRHEMRMQLIQRLFEALSAMDPESTEGEGPRQLGQAQEE